MVYPDPVAVLGRKQVKAEVAKKRENVSIALVDAKKAEHENERTLAMARQVETEVHVHFMSTVARPLVRLARKKPG